MKTKNIFIAVSAILLKKNLIIINMHFEIKIKKNRINKRAKAIKKLDI